MPSTQQLCAINEAESEANAEMSPDDLNPGYVPSRFSRRRQVTGASVQAISGSGERAVVLFVNPGDPHRPLEVASSADVDARLTGTEERAGTPVDLGVANVTARYHDGMWAPGPGLDQIDNGEVVIHWDTGECHSITTVLREGAVAVRAPKSVDLEALLRIARSVPAIANG